MEKQEIKWRNKKNGINEWKEDKRMIENNQRETGWKLRMEKEEERREGMG